MVGCGSGVQKQANGPVGRAYGIARGTSGDGRHDSVQGAPDLFGDRLRGRAQRLGWEKHDQGSSGARSHLGFDGPDRLRGGFDADELRGGRGDDFIAAESGVDFLYGGGGEDLINPGMGHDKVFGSLGNDTIRTWADEGSTDKISCGGDRDSLVRSPDDRVIDDPCEVVRVKRDQQD